MSIPRKVKQRIRMLIAVELRDRLTEVPGHLNHLPSNDPLVANWREYVLFLAEQMSPECRSASVIGDDRSGENPRR